MGHSSRQEGCRQWAFFEPRVTLSRALAVLLIAALLITIVTVAGAAARELQSWPAMSAEELSRLRYKAVLVAGDQSVPAFDHATEAMRDRLLARQAAAGDVQRLSASPAVIGRDGARSSSLDHVLSAIEHLRPSGGEGCLVFATSHGSYEDGLVLMPSENFLTPAALDAVLVSGCGHAPTVVIISGCFTGGFARPPMARPNRVILTAAREDRPSFGCGAGFQYTVYDRCLLRGMDAAATWRDAYAMIRSCVATRERAMRFRPSEPQAFFGEAVEGMPIPRPR